MSFTPTSQPCYDENCGSVSANSVDCYHCPGERSEGCGHSIRRFQKNERPSDTVQCHQMSEFVIKFSHISCIIRCLSFRKRKIPCKIRNLSIGTHFGDNTAQGQPPCIFLSLRVLYSLLNHQKNTCKSFISSSNYVYDELSKMRHLKLWMDEQIILEQQITAFLYR